MKRLRAHVSVGILAENMRLYSAPSGAERTASKPDDAKWMLDDPHAITVK